VIPLLFLLSCTLLFAIICTICSKEVGGKRKREELPDGSGWGDHIIASDIRKLGPNRI